MNSLNTYVDDMNRWNSIFGKSAMTFPLTQKNVTDLCNKIDGELSPENLHCDGEISVAEANKKYRFLKAVAGELEQYCFRNNLRMGVLYEL